MIKNCTNYSLRKNYVPTFARKEAFLDAANLISMKEGALPVQIKKALNSSNKKNVKKFLADFLTLEIPILMTNTQKDVIDSVQIFADKIIAEKNNNFISKYIEILHKAICPDTGVGKYINADKLSTRSIHNNLLNEVLANVKKYVKRV